MQTTAISVVSDVESIGSLEKVKDFIDTMPTFVTVDMTTGVQLSEGVYPDCIVAKTAPILIPPDPIVPLPAAMRDFLNSSAFHAFSALVVLAAVPMFPGSLLLSTPRDREIAFVASTGVMILVYGLHVCNFRGRLLAMVAKSFEFWYLLVFQAAACLSGAYLYHSAGVSIVAVSVCFPLYCIAHGVFAFGIDASPYSRRVRAAFMIFWAFTYAVIFVAARFAEYLYPEDVYKGFVSFEINLLVAQMTPRQGMLTTLITLILFFVKYATLIIWNGAEFVSIWFEGRLVSKPVGEIRTDKVSGRRKSLFRLNSDVTAANPDEAGTGATRLGRPNPLTHVAAELATTAASGPPAARRRSIANTFRGFSNHALIESMESGTFVMDLEESESLGNFSPPTYTVPRVFRAGSRDEDDKHPLWSDKSPERKRNSDGAAREDSTFGALVTSDSNATFSPSANAAAAETRRKVRFSDGGLESPSSNSIRMDSVSSEDHV